MEVKITKKWDGKLKGLRFEESSLIDENGEVINLNELLYTVYADKYFDLSVTAKEEQMVDTDDNEAVAALLEEDFDEE